MSIVTVEQEDDRQLSFLDTLLVTRNHGSLTTTIFRKPTHTDKYLDYSSHHDKQHKISTARTLFHRAATLPNTDEGKQDERKHVIDALRAHGYPMKFLAEVERKHDLAQKTTSSPEELVRQFFEKVEPKSNDYVVIPYIRGLTESLKRLLKPYGIKVTTKPLCTLEQMLPSPKNRPSQQKQTNVVYQINCQDCSWGYIDDI